MDINENLKSIIKGPPHISIISPVYLATEMLEELVKEICNSVSEITNDYEIILVDDGSPDSSWDKIKDICLANKMVRGVKLSRNFGQHYAITAGISKAKGEYIVLLDCDLQDDPKYIPKLYNKAQEGFDIIFTKRLERKHSFFKKLGSIIFNLLFRILSDMNYRVQFGSLVMFTSRVREEFLKISDQDRLYIQLLKWLGFNQTWIGVEHRERFSGSTSYSLHKLISIALAGWTAHSDKLLKISIYFGLSFALMSFVGMLVILVFYLKSGFQSGWTSLSLLLLLSTGLILTSIGIVGVYIGKNFEQSKNRPLFIVDQEINFNEKE